MKASVILSVGVFALTACAPERGVLSVQDARAVATGKPIRTKVAGFYMVHSEGDSLLNRSGSLGDDILLFGPGPYWSGRNQPEVSFDKVTNSERAIVRAQLDGKFVVVTGTLVRGTTPIGGIPNCVFMVVERTERANKAPEPTPVSVTPRAIEGQSK